MMQNSMHNVGDKNSWWPVGICIGLWAAVSAAQGASVDEIQRDDGQRVPIAVYERSMESCLPLALVSPGAGGSESGYSYLGEGLQGLGWRVIVMAHPESSRQVMRAHIRQEGIKGGVASTAQDASALAARLQDIQGALRWAQSRCPAPAKPPRLILLGHSMGATTVNLEAGARNNMGIRGQDRFDAYIALSPQGVGTVFPQGTWSDIRKPFLQLTGSEDKALEGGPDTRTDAFNNLPGGCQWLAIVHGATHMNFAGRGRSARVEAITLKVIDDFLTGTTRDGCRPTIALSDVTLRSK